MQLHLLFVKVKTTALQPFPFVSYYKNTGVHYFSIRTDEGNNASVLPNRLISIYMCNACIGFL